MRETPQHGIAIFTGHVIVGNNKTRMTTIVLDDPPEPFRSFRYRCDSTFEVTQLEDMLIDKTCYGIFVIDRGEAGTCRSGQREIGSLSGRDAIQHHG